MHFFLGPLRVKKLFGQTPLIDSILECVELNESKKEGKDQESIQSSTTPDPGYQWENDNFTIRHHKREPRGQLK